jgi:hypothetical protein
MPICWVLCEFEQFLPPAEHGIDWTDKRLPQALRLLRPRLRRLWVSVAREETIVESGS